jgi:hypothetical protein
VATFCLQIKNPAGNRALVELSQNRAKIETGMSFRAFNEQWGSAPAFSNLNWSD